MIAMSHYPLLPGVPLFGLLGGEVVMKNADYITTLLADEGVHLCFTGHMHNQAVNKKVTEKGNLFYDVCTGSLIGCPASMRLVTITDNYRVQLETLPVPDFDWDLEGLTKDEYFRRQFDMMIDTYLTSMRDDPARFLGKLGMKEAPEGVRNVVEKVGGYLNGVTVGRLCKTLCVKCPEEIRDTLFVDLARELVRNCFTGNAPYVYGTPEYAAIMGVIGRFAKFIKINVNGKSVEFLPLVEKTIGKYGLDDDNTSFTLR